MLCLILTNSVRKKNNKQCLNGVLCFTYSSLPLTSAQDMDQSTTVACMAWTSYLFPWTQACRSFMLWIRDSSQCFSGEIHGMFCDIQHFNSDEIFSILWGLDSITVCTYMYNMQNYKYAFNIDKYIIFSPASYTCNFSSKSEGLDYTVLFHLWLTKGFC